jgi:hypothetical protein
MSELKLAELLPPKGFAIDPECGGRPHCGPPQHIKKFYSVIVAGVTFAATDMAFCSTIGKSFMEPIAREMSDTVFMIIGYVVAAVMFSTIYTNYARISRKPFDSKKESENSYRFKKGLKYGLAIGALLFIPATSFKYAVIEGLNLWNQSIDVVFHILQTALVGVIVAFIQKASIETS